MIYNPSNPSPGVVYSVGSPEFVGKMPIRTELTVLEADDVRVVRKAIYDLLNVFPIDVIEEIYTDCMKDATVMAVMEL